MVTFGRTETWSGGWRGKQSSTAIRLNGTGVGEIRGEESAATPGTMTYTIHVYTMHIQSLVNCRLGSLKEAKETAVSQIT